MSGDFRTPHLNLDDSSDEDLKAVIGELFKAKPDFKAEVIAGLDDIRLATGQRATTVMDLDRGSLVQMIERMVKRKPGLAIEIRARLKNAHDRLFEDYLGEQKFTDEERKKLIEMVSDANYQRSVQAANELDTTCKVPTKGMILAELIKLPPKRLKEICKMQEKPTIVIVPPNSFAEKVAAMNKANNKHYIHPNGQENAYVNASSDSPYTNAPKMATGKVSIVDGVVHPKAPTGRVLKVSNKLGKRRDHYTALYRSKNMEHIDKDEYAILMQMSLIEAAQANDNKKIIDNLEGSGTATFFNPVTLTKSSLVAYGFFYSNFRQVVFYANFPDRGNDDLRGRSSVPVFEFEA